jgi:hypothetical protein
MIFLVEYNRPQGKLLTFRAFDAADRSIAQAEKFELELRLHRRGIEHEVVLLEADSEAKLRRSYQRYFEELPAMLRSAIDAVKPRPS